MSSLLATNRNVKRSRSQRSAPISADTWEGLRDEIYVRYISEGLTRQEILEWLREEYDFQPSSRQLTWQLKNWGYYKKRSYLRPKALTEQLAHTSICSLELASLICEQHWKVCGSTCTYRRPGTPPTDGALSGVSMLFAIPSLRVLTSLESLGLHRYARVCAAAYWKTVCSQNANLGAEGVIIPSLESMMNMDSVLRTTQSAYSVTRCESLLRSIPWQRFLSSCSKHPRFAFWLALQSACNRLNVTSLFSHSRDIIVAPRQDGDMHGTSGRSLESSAKARNGEQFIHPKVKQFNRPSQMAPYVLDPQTERDFKTVIEHCVEEPSHIPSDYMKGHVVSLSTFEILTVCFEMLYGNQIGTAVPGPSSNKPYFDTLVSQLAVAVSSSTPSLSIKHGKPVSINHSVVQLVS